MLQEDKWMSKSYQNLNRYLLVILKFLKPPPPPSNIPTQVPWSRYVILTVNLKKSQRIYVHVLIKLKILVCRIFYTHPNKR